MPKRGRAGGAGKKGGGKKGGGVPTGRAREIAEARATFFDGGDDSEVSSVASDDEARPTEEEEEEEEAAAREETVEEARLRAARKYIAELKAGKKDEWEGGESDEEEEEEEEDEDELLSSRLAAERAKLLGSAFEPFADRIRDEVDFLADDDETARVVLKGHRGAVTCCALTATHCVSGAKDNSVALFDLETQKLSRWLLERWPKRACAAVEEARKNNNMQGADDEGGGEKHHPLLAPRQAREAEILSVAASADGRFVAAAGRDALIHLWDLRVSSTGGGPSSILRGHKGAVTAVAFKDDVARGLDDDDLLVAMSGDENALNAAHVPLYSGGDDGSLKHWEAARGAYIETLYGHEAPVRCVDCAYDERPLSGAGDRTARSWKIKDDSHLVYRASTNADGLGSSVDCCLILDANRFASAGDDGALALWSTKRKKPVSKIDAAHGRGAAAQSRAPTTANGDSNDEALAPARWLTAVGGRRGSDVLFSGSCDGLLRLWRAGLPEAPKLEALATAPLLGYLNAIRVPASMRFAAVAASHEHRLGRWGDRVRKAPNAVVIIPLLAQ